MNKSERVEIFLPKGYAGEEPHVLVGINGVNYLLPRGAKSRVPAAVAAELERSRKAQAALDARVDQLLKQ